MTNSQDKNYGKPGQQITVPKGNIWSKSLPAKVTLSKKRCWQCRKISVVNHDDSTYCLNACGPQSLGRLLSF